MSHLIRVMYQEVDRECIVETMDDYLTGGEGVIGVGGDKTFNI